MSYQIKYLEKVALDLHKNDRFLSKNSPQAANKLLNDFVNKIESLKDFPRQFQTYEYKPAFRSIPLLYGYRVFYKINEKNKIVQIHRMIYGGMNLNKQLKNEK